jgi:hypothetical protein
MKLRTLFLEKGTKLYLFIIGLVALFIVPFLAWFTYPAMNFLFPPNVSMIYLFEWQAGNTPLPLDSPLILYLEGVAAAIIVVTIARRPFFFQGILVAAYPAWTLVVGTLQSIGLIYPQYPHYLTIGMFTALLGSALLELSYFSYRKIARKHSNGDGELKKTTASNVEAVPQ